LNKGGLVKKHLLKNQNISPPFYFLFDRKPMMEKNITISIVNILRIAEWFQLELKQV